MGSSGKDCREARHSGFASPGKHDMTRKLKLGWGEKLVSGHSVVDGMYICGKSIYSRAAYKGFRVYCTAEATEQYTYLVRPDGAVFCSQQTVFMDIIKEYINYDKNLMEWNHVGYINGNSWSRIENT